GVDPIAGGPGATVGDEIDLQVPGLTLLAPVADPDRYLAAQPAGRSQGPLRPTHLSTELCQVAGDGGSAGGQQQGSCLRPRRKLAVLLEQLQQVGQEGLQALGADVAGRLPEHAQVVLESLAIAATPWLADHSRLPLAAAQHAHGVLAAVTSSQAEGIEHGAALPPA